MAAVSPLPPPEPAPAPRSAAFEADLALLRTAMITWPMTGLISRLTQRVLRRSYQQLVTTAQRVALGVVATLLRFLGPVGVTTATTSWAGAPVWTWLGVAAFVGASEAYGARVGSESSMERTVALPAVIDREADLRELLAFTRRWWRPGVYVPAAVVIALVVLAATAVVAPDEFRALHPGSLALLALLLYEYGESASMRLIYFMLYAKESRYLHRLSWLSPFDSPPIQSLLSIWRQAAIVGSLLMTMSFVLAAILIAPASVTVLLAPVAGFTLVTLVIDTASMMSVRTSVQGIVRHTKEAALESLRERIEGLEPRTRELTPAESEELQALLATYAAVREAPTGPTGAQTFGHAISALAIPAIAFFLAVMAEVYAERLLNQLLP